YTAFLVLFALVALLRRTPLLFGSAALVVPLLTLAVSGVGWLQVQRSEGTKAGSNLALWGMLLSLLSGLSYGAYYGASALAIQQQSQPFVVDWFEKLKKGQTAEAFRLTLPPPSRPPEGKDLRGELELRFNSGPDGGGRGPFNAFNQGDLARFCQQGGADTKITPLGVNEWKYQEGGYRIHQTFQVDTPEAQFQGLLATHGIDSPGGQGRQWRIVYDETNLRQVPAPTPLAVRMIELRGGSTLFLRDWLQNLAAGRLEDVYLDTRPPAERAADRD